MECYAAVQRVQFVLHGAIFIATCVATLERTVHCKLLQTFCTVHSVGLQLAVASKNLCNCCKCRPKLYFVQSLQGQKVARQVAERVCYTLQPTCNLSRNAIAAQVARKIVSCYTSFLVQHTSYHFG